MPKKTTGISRRRAITLASATIAGVALPSWATVATAAPIAPVVDDPLIGDGLSQLFRHRDWWLRKHWYHYLAEVAEYRGVANPDVRRINFERWFFEMKLSQVVRTVPETQPDRDVKDYAHRLVLALLADFREVPWRHEVAASLEKCRSWGLTGGISPNDREAFQRRRRTTAS
jgi:hypothetical protein